MRKGTHHTPDTIRKMQRPRGEKRPAIERFAEKVDRNGPIIRPEIGRCHTWLGKRRHGKFAYGLFYYRARWRAAHRWLWEQIVGPLPDGFCALHRCDNPSCVNFNHLFAGTRRDNVADMDAKHRRVPARGERQAGAKLSYQDADNIRWAYSIGGLTLKELARWSGVSESTIGRVVHGQTWRPEKQAA